MKRNTTNEIIDCLDGNANTNHEWMKIVACLFKEYFEDKYGDDAENIYDCNDEYDVECLMNQYGVRNAVKLVTSANFGYVIAGYNLDVDECIFIDENNFWAVLKNYSDLIEERIEYYFDKEKFCWEDIERIYPSLDIKKFIFGDSRIFVREVTNNRGEITKQDKEFETREDAESWIFSELKSLMDGKKDFKIHVISDEDTYEFQDKGNVSLTKFVLVDYTDRALVQ